MHPRNIYNKPPDFKELSIDYPEFRKYVSIDLSGRVSVNFKDPDAIRALTRALLHRDFGLEVEIPKDNLVPTVPQRFNYILWVQDLLALLPKEEDGHRLIDIGTGPSCVFPLIGGKKFAWRFLASEINSDAVDCAVRNVTKNGLSDKIKVVKVEKESCLSELVGDKDTFSLSMCNPPFFKDSTDANWEKKCRTNKRGAPKSCNSASTEEKIVDGGEVGFVKRMIMDSALLRERIKIYTTMLGKQSSLKCVKEELRNRKIGCFTVTEFVQGKTTRWGVAWTFLSNVNLNKTLLGQQKEIPPVSYFIPNTIQGTEYNLESITQRILELLVELKIEKEAVESTSTVQCYKIKARENTWSHQRRKRRELLRVSMPSQIGKDLNGTPSSDLHNGTESSAPKKRKFEDDSDLKSPEADKDGTNVVATQDQKADLKESSNNEDSIFESFLSVKMFGSNIILELKGISAINRDVFNQVLQFFKNKLK